MADRCPVSVVGLHGGAWFGQRAASAVYSADVLVGAARMHAALPADVTGEQVELSGPLDQVLDVIEERSGQGHRVCVLASGDPGFFGIERLLVGRFGDAVEVYPAPSSVAMAFARARVNWDDAAVVSCHGRSLQRALPFILSASKVGILVSPTCPAQAVGRALLDAGATHQQAIVCSRIGEDDESVTRTDLSGLASGTFDPLSVLILTSDAPPHDVNAVVAWGRPEPSFAHRAGMITKPEVRAAVLAKLELFPAATMWDVGAGSGSVGIEAARLAPGLRVYAIEQNGQDCQRISSNSVRVPVTVIEGRAPEAYDQLPDPDRVFLGGGGLVALEHALARVRPDAVVACTYTTMETALSAVTMIGSDAEMIQIQVNRGVPIGPDGRLRLEAENPVFVVWGRP